MTDSSYLPKVLIVDDNKVNRQILSVFLFEMYDVRTATSGSEALAMLQAISEDEQLSDLVAIILDIMMPDLDGFQVLAAIRENYGTIPVIMCTAKNDRESVVRAVDLGANDFLLKPFRQKVLMAKLAKFERDKVHEDQTGS